MPEPRSRYGPEVIDERFDGPDLDASVWTGAYLPAWSSYAEAAAAYALTPDGLRLSLPPDHPRRCPDRHVPPLRVSAVQTGNWSGAPGSTRGQQPFVEGLTVREQQPAHWGYTPRFGRLEVELSATVGPRSMFSAWMAGLTRPTNRAGPSRRNHPPSQARAPARPIHAPRRARSVGRPRSTSRHPSRRHAYAVDWRPGRVRFFLDDELVRTCPQAPDYPMQLIIGLFDFPEHPDPDGREPAEPALTVHRVTGSR